MRTKMNSDILDQEETELLASYDAGEWHSVAEAQSEKDRYREAAHVTLVDKTSKNDS